MVAAGAMFGVFPTSGETPDAGPTDHGPPDGALHDEPEDGIEVPLDEVVHVDQRDQLPCLRPW